MVDINVRTNLPDFKRQLANFSADFQKKTIKSALSAAATKFKNLAIARAPVLNPLAPTRKKNPRISGLLRKAIYSTRSRSKSGAGKETWSVSFRQGRSGAAKGLDAFYGRFLEAGWTPRGPGKGLKGGRRSKALQRSRANGAKIVRYKFLEPAFRQGGSAALQAFVARIERRINKENQKR